MNDFELRSTPIVEAAFTQRRLEDCAGNRYLAALPPIPGLAALATSAEYVPPGLLDAEHLPLGDRLARLRLVRDLHVPTGRFAQFASDFLAAVHGGYIRRHHARVERTERLREHYAR